MAFPFLADASAKRVGPARTVDAIDLFGPENDPIDGRNWTKTSRRTRGFLVEGRHTVR